MCVQDPVKVTEHSKGTRRALYTLSTPASLTVRCLALDMCDHLVSAARYTVQFVSHNMTGGRRIRPIASQPLEISSAPVKRRPLTRQSDESQPTYTSD